MVDDKEKEVKKPGGGVDEDTKEEDELSALDLERTSGGMPLGNTGPSTCAYTCDKVLRDCGGNGLIQP